MLNILLLACQVAEEEEEEGGGGRRKQKKEKELGKKIKECLGWGVGGTLVVSGGEVGVTRSSEAWCARLS